MLTKSQSCSVDKYKDLIRQEKRKKYVDKHGNEINDHDVIKELEKGIIVISR